MITCIVAKLQKKGQQEDDMSAGFFKTFLLLLLERDFNFMVFME